MEDKELIQACLQGDLEAFKVIVDKYTAQAIGLAMNILGNREDAQDVLQETFVQAFRNMSRFDLGRSFKTWLYTILYRRCLDQLKKRRRFEEAFSKMKNEDKEELRTGTAVKCRNPSPDQQPLSQNILAHLSLKERSALCLWANEGYSAVEISRVLHCSASTARVTLFNARRKIKTMMENRNARL
jgi:RNA polymerase sigma-70 factor, ECF subfamily